MHPTEQLLTAKEIAGILIDATDPVLSDPRIIPIGLHRTSVVRVAKPSGLIFFKGDEHTGLEHISLRHSYHSLKRTFQEQVSLNGDRTMRLDDPSRFRPGLIPIVDYVNIGNNIFTHGNRDEQGNHRPDLFEKYTGSFLFNDGKAEKHTLILYKNTKIVHTLFPQRDKNNRPRLSNFLLQRGRVSAEWKLRSSVVEIKIPYLNKDNITKYTIIFFFNGTAKKQGAVLWAHDEKGNYYQSLLLAEVNLEGDIKDKYYDGPMQLQYADLRKFEQVMKDTEGGLIPFENIG